MELTGIDVEAEAQNAADLLQQLNDFVSGDLQDVQDGIATASDVTNDIELAVQKIEINDWQSLIILIPWIMVPSFLLVGVLMASWNVANPLYESIMTWFFLPLLIIMTIVSVVLAALVSVAAVGNAGMCSNMYVCMECYLFLFVRWESLYTHSQSFNYY